MKDFTSLYIKLDQTEKANRKLSALVEYFGKAGDSDKLWAIALFTHRRPKRIVTTNMLRKWALEYSGIPGWLFEESYKIVGDLAETVSLIVPEMTEVENEYISLTHWIDLSIFLQNKNEIEKKSAILNAWKGMSRDEGFIFNKIITGGFRGGVSERIMIKALARYSGLDPKQVALRISGNWDPATTTFKNLLEEEHISENASRPYPFFQAIPLEVEYNSLGLPENWLVERKWEGFRAQIVRRNNEVFVWTAEEEIVTNKYPEFILFSEKLGEGTVLDGIVLPYKDGHPLAFHELQVRSKRKNLSRSLLTNTPVIFMAFDILEYEGTDIRALPLKERRCILEKIISKTALPALKLSEEIMFDDWEELADILQKCRNYRCEGLMLKKLSSPYMTAEGRGDWRKLKGNPEVIDAVMIYAQRGHGRHANLYSEYTFAVWKDDQLVPFAKANTGLSEAEIIEVDRFVKQNTLERFGPVRSLTPELVFEIAFEGIYRSPRRKSGIAVRSPRISRWKKDRRPEEASSLKDLIALLYE